MTDQAAQRWGLWRMPEDPLPGELKWVRNSLALPAAWRGLVQAYDTRDEASDAWSEGHFIRAIARENDASTPPVEKEAGWHAPPSTA